MCPIPRLASKGRWRVEAMRSYTSPLFLWFTRGQGRVTVSGIQRGYGPMSVVFIPPGRMHSFEVGPQVFGTALFFPGHTAPSLPQRPLNFRLRDTAQQTELAVLVENINRELAADMLYRTEALDLHAGILALWLIRRQAEIEESAKKDDASRRLAERFTTMVEAQFRSGKGVQEYAADLGVTPTHLSRACREAAGRPASKLLADRVIAEARRLLADTEMPVNEVSRRLGYSSAAYFTRAFQGHTGQTPSAFRKSA